jgi:translocator protein
MRKILKLIISIAVPLAVGSVSGLFTVSEISGWYQTINKPSWNPPSWIFAPVWTTLYIMMGIALYLVWTAEVKPAMKKTAIAFFVIQLVFNFFWSFIFFKQHQIGLAFVEIFVMFVFILMTIFSFARINKAAAWLLVPYISWVSFATILTYTIWQLN